MTSAIYYIATEKENLIETANISCRRIKPIALIIWSHENFELKYIRIKLYCFFITFRPPLPKVISVAMGNCLLLWAAKYELTFCISIYLLTLQLEPPEDKKKIEQKFMNIFWNKERCVPLNHKPWYEFVGKSMQSKISIMV